LLITGFCTVLVKPAGPAQAYVVPAGAALAVRFREVPAQRGVLLPAVGVGGALKLVRVKGPAELEVHPLADAVMLE
jgi:hypothetical protein